MTHLSNFRNTQVRFTPSMIGTAGIYDDVNQSTELMVNSLVHELMIWFPSSRQEQEINSSRDALTHWVYEQLHHPLSHDDVLAFLSQELQSKMNYESCQ